MEDDEDGRFGGLYLGDNADGEKLAEKVGAEKMNMLVEGFEEMSGRVLPSPMEDAYIDALHTNCMVSIMILFFFFNQNLLNLTWCIDIWSLIMALSNAD